MSRSPEELLKDLFAALDGEGISFEAGRTSRDNPILIGGLGSFTSNWEQPSSFQGDQKRWEEMTPEEQWNRTAWSAQHALVKRLGELRQEYEEMLAEEGQVQPQEEWSPELLIEMEGYPGQWVAVSNGKLVAHADNLKALLEKVGVDVEATVLKVPVAGEQAMDHF